MKRFLDGLNMLAAKYGTESMEIAAEHDVVYVGVRRGKGEWPDYDTWPEYEGEFGPERYDPVFTEEEARKLENLGWMWDDEYESWRKFV